MSTSLLRILDKTPPGSITIVNAAPGKRKRKKTEGGARNSCQEGTKAEFYRGGGASYHARGWEEYNCHQKEIHHDNNQRSKGKSVDLNNEVGELDQRERRQGMAGCSEEMDRHLMLCKDEAPQH